MLQDSEFFNWCVQTVLSHFAEFFTLLIPPPFPPMRLIKTPRVFSGPKSNLQYTTHFGAGKKKGKTW